MIRILLATSRIDLQELLERATRADMATQLLAVARNGSEAVTMARQLLPDVVAVDLRLDEDIAEAVMEIMVSAPAPIVMVSREDGIELGARSDRALEAGALAVIRAPSAADGRLDTASAEKFLSTIKAMAQVKVVRQWRRKAAGAPRTDPVAPVAPAARITPIGIVGIAASTGGPAAIRSILMKVSAAFPAPILVVQHMSNGFIDGVAASLDATVPMRVKVAADGERLRPGTVYLAPDGYQLGVSGRSRIRVADDAPVDGFKPSGSYLFDSIARAFKDESLAVVLTGMGNDGTEGLRLLRKAGGKAIAQDETSSIVFGMPKSAIAAGLVDHVLPLDSIAAKIVALAGGRNDA